MMALPQCMWWTTPAGSYNPIKPMLNLEQNDMKHRCVGSQSDRLQMAKPASLDQCNTLECSEIPNNHLGWFFYTLFQKQGINYQPQLVSWTRILSINSFWDLCFWHPIRTSTTHRKPSYKVVKVEHQSSCGSASGPLRDTCGSIQ